MPWSRSQSRLFHAAAEDADVAAKVKIPQKTAKKLAGEGVAKALRDRKRQRTRTRPTY